MAVRIRLKKLGRRHRPFFRVCAMDSHVPRDGRVIEELGHYDPMVRDTDARAILDGERISYWLGVGAQPTEKVHALIKKYGKDGTHLDQQKAALERLSVKKTVPLAAVPPAQKPAAEATPEAEAAPAAEESAAAETPGESPDAVAEETSE